VGSVLAGFVGVPAALGGGNRIEHYLEPSFEAHGAVDDRGAVAAAEAARQHGLAASPESAAAAAHADEGHHVALERTLMLVSTLVAFTGIGLAYFFYIRRPQAADAVAARAGGLYRLLLDKYYVDEIYDAVLVRPIGRLSERVLRRRVDAGLIDGAVNGAGTFVSSGSAVLRRLQTGSLKVYAASLFLGVVTIVGYYLWRIAEAAQRGV
jgi:NADH-quinone oxidoreductase subunit L